MIPQHCHGPDDIQNGRRNPETLFRVLRFGDVIFIDRYAMSTIRNRDTSTHLTIISLDNDVSFLPRHVIMGTNTQTKLIPEKSSSVYVYDEKPILTWSKETYVLVHSWSMVPGHKRIARWINICKRLFWIMLDFDLSVSLFRPNCVIQNGWQDLTKCRSTSSFNILDYMLLGWIN